VFFAPCACIHKKSVFLRKNIHALGQGYRNTLVKAREMPSYRVFAEFSRCALGPTLAETKDTTIAMAVSKESTHLIIDAFCLAP
jgi:hypothetical protein